MRRHDAMRSDTGQVAAETVVMVSLVVAGLVAMAVYVQRAMQGSVYQSSRSFGSQFGLDPGDTYTERRAIGRVCVEVAGGGECEQWQDTSETTTREGAVGMVDAPLIDTDPISIGRTRVSGIPHPNWVLDSLPTGYVPREPAGFSEQLVDSKWGTESDATYVDVKMSASNP